MEFMDDAAFVIWKWNWREEFEIASESSEAEITVIPETPPSSPMSVSFSDGEHSDEEDSAVAGCDKALITHELTFKCIGCTKELTYQETLAAASQLLSKGKIVPCTIEPEPHNPVDSEAIAIKCKVSDGGEWKTVGYIVREALQEVHAALKNNKVQSVSFDWVKFVIYWKVPGWYAGVRIKRTGEWSQKVVSAQSAKQ